MTVYLKQMNCYWSYYGISPKTMRHFLCKTLVPWLSSLLQLGSTWMNGPNFWRSRRSSVKNLYKKFSWGFEHVAKNPSSCKSQCRFSKISHGNEIIWTWSNENEAPSTLSQKWRIIRLKWNDIFMIVWKWNGIFFRTWETEHCTHHRMKMQ